MPQFFLPRNASSLLLGLLMAGAATVNAQSGATAPVDAPATVRLSPETRIEALPAPLSTALKRNLIEPFLAEPMVIDESALLGAPRIVAAQENRVLLSRGDRAYVRSTGGTSLEYSATAERRFRVFRDATPLKDPGTGAVLGYEAQFIGSAVLTASEGVETVQDDDKPVQRAVPATVVISGAKEEIRAGDRLLEVTPPRLDALIPHAAAPGTSAQIISVYGSNAIHAGQNQIVVVNRGKTDGLKSGDVMAIQKRRATAIDKTSEGSTPLLLPEERNGLAMVFMTFEKVAYALVVQVTDTVRIGDRLSTP
ncbi:MAG: peptidoglycan-binding protein [Rhodoferax sp.]